MSQFTTLLSKLGPITKQVLGTYAPTALKMFGGPFGALAGNALQALFGTSDPDQLETQMAAISPDNVVKLKQIEADLQTKMRELGIEEEDLYLKDVQSARAMQIATKDVTPGRLAWLVILGFFIVSGFECVAMVFWPEQWGKIPADALNLLGIIFGFLASEAKSASAFYFGSSAGSQEKDKTLAEIAKQ